MAKSQATMFMIIGLIVVLVFAMVYLASTQVPDELVPQIEKTADFAKPVHRYIDICGDISSRFAVHTVASQGGYYEAPAKATAFSVYMVPYYYDQDEGPMVPSVSDIEEQLSRAMEDAMNSCTGNFTTFRDQGYSISQKGLETMASVRDGSVAFEVDYDLDIISEGRYEHLGEFAFKADTNMKKHYSLASTAIQEQDKMPNNVRLSRLMDLGYQNKVIFNTVYGEDKVIYIITENRSGKQEAFTYAVRYDWDDIELPAGDPQYIELEAYTGYPFLYTFEEPGEYYDYTGLFEITGAGVITFVPHITDAGEHDILIARETGDQIVYYEMKLNVISDNTAPVIDDIPMQEITLSESSTFEYQASAGDAEGDQIFYNVLSSIDGLEIDILTGRMALDASGIEPTIYTITVVATDVKGASSDEVFNLVIK
jgi:hypothetical protein